MFRCLKEKRMGTLPSSGSGRVDVAMKTSVLSKGNDFFTTLSPQRTFVMLLLLSSTSVLLWAGSAKVDVIVRTEGQIIPAGKSQIVQHLEGGIVRKDRKSVV